MVQIDVVRSCNSKLVKAQPLVAVFVGGTSGIGEYTVQALAATHSNQGKGLRIYIVGRNADAADKTISECSLACPNGQFRFLKAQDLALLKDVDRICDEIVRIEQDENIGGGTPRVDLLVMSQAYLTFEGRRETDEGLDTVMSLLYYSRMRFILKLLPLLLKSSLPAHVVSVYAAGKESNIFPEDLSLRHPKNYSFINARSHVVYMTTFFLETLAERHKGQLSLVHVFPSLVMTKGFDSEHLPTWLKLIWRWLAAPILRPFSVPPRECGQRILYLATSRFPPRSTDGTETAVESEETGTTTEYVEIAVGTDGGRGSGAYAVDWDAETISTEIKYKKVREEDLGRIVWAHTMRAFEEIEAGASFTD